MDYSDRKGVVLVICAPSGAGKTTLVRRLLDEFPRFTYSVSCTTRGPREGEVDGRDYHFLSAEDFRRRIGENFFAEWAEVHGNYYGTPLQETLDTLAAGRDMLFDIDVQGAGQLKKNLPFGKYIFIFPPSRKALRDRLLGRGTDDLDTIERRMINAYGEIQQAPEFDTWIINDDLDDAYELLRAAYLTATAEPRCRESFLPELQTQWKE